MRVTKVLDVEPPQCGMEAMMKRFKFQLANTILKEHLALPSQETSSLFYQQNHTNKPLTLSYYRLPKCVKDKEMCGYRNRALKCFPEAAPLACPPMVHRTKAAYRPRSTNDVIKPTHQTVNETFTLKIDKRFLRKE